jgi:Tfp pilus assembly protein PilX
MRRARNEDGFALVSAIVLLTVIMALGLGLLLFTDNQQKASAREQASEAAFNVAEAALNAQVGQLSRKWPQKLEEMPERCTSSSANNETNDCPSPTDVKLDPNTGSTTCSGTEAWGSPLSNQWTTYVRRDIGESPLFSSTAEQPEPSFAESEGGALWVRSVGVVQCHPVTVVTLVTRLRVPLILPEDAIAGNWFKVTNNGEKIIVDRTGFASEPAPVSMRCNEGTIPLKECEQYKEGKHVSQVSPSTGEEDPKTSVTTLTTSQLATLKSEAQAYKTYYSLTSPYHCPTSMNELEGVKLSTGARAPVYVEGCNSLSIKANGVANCEPPTPAESPPKPESPGFLIVANGTLELSGNSTYCGVIYAANLQKSSGAVVKLQGGTVVVGGIIVDGAGGIEFGSSGQGGNPANLVFDSLAIHNLTISAGAASTRNSFRILPAGQ